MISPAGAGERVCVGALVAHVVVVAAAVVRVLLVRLPVAALHQVPLNGLNKGERVYLDQPALPLLEAGALGVPLETGEDRETFVEYATFMKKLDG